MPLTPSPIAPDSTTRQLDYPDERISQARWGTARLGAERKLLLAIEGHATPLVVTLAEHVVLGRTDPDTGAVPEVALDDYNGMELGVSRRHAVIFLDGDSVKIEDLGSYNSSYLNGQKLFVNQPRILRDGDEVHLGRLAMRIHFS